MVLPRTPPAKSLGKPGAGADAPPQGGTSDQPTETQSAAPADTSISADSLLSQLDGLTPPKSAGDTRDQVWALVQIVQEAVRHAKQQDRKIMELRGIVTSQEGEISQLKFELGCFKGVQQQQQTTFTQLDKFQRDEQMRPYIVSAPTAIQPAVLKKQLYDLGGYDTHQCISMVEMGHPKKAGADGQPVVQQDRKLYKVTSRSRVTYGILDLAHRLKQKQGCGDIYVNESLLPAQRKIKQQLLASPAFKTEKEALHEGGKVIRWRNGLPYSVLKGAVSGAPMTALDVALPHLPKPAPAPTPGGVQPPLPVEPYPSPPSSPAATAAGASAGISLPESLLDNNQ